MAKDDKEKTSWRDKNVSLPAGLIVAVLSAFLSAGGIKLADNAWPTKVEVRLALIEKQQKDTLTMLGALAAHHNIDPKLLSLPNGDKEE
jgi:hypothetical protein